MNLHKFSHAKELISVAEKIGIKISVMVGEDAEEYISFILKKYKPWKKEGHLSISGDISSLSTDENEFTFSLSMKHIPAFLFFEQNFINKNTVILIDNASEISTLMQNSHGMEYFISDENGTYLIAINWYSIEFTGDVLLT
ncbi:hypothetical protein ABFP30_000493 [Enterobacter bugandensis]